MWDNMHIQCDDALYFLVKKWCSQSFLLLKFRYVTKFGVKLHKIISTELFFARHDLRSIFGIKCLVETEENNFFKCNRSFLCIHSQLHIFIFSCIINPVLALALNLYGLVTYMLGLMFKTFGYSDFGKKVCSKNVQNLNTNEVFFYTELKSLLFLWFYKTWRAFSRHFIRHQCFL